MTTKLTRVPLLALAAWNTSGGKKMQSSSYHSRPYSFGILFKLSIDIFKNVTAFEWLKLSLILVFICKHLSLSLIFYLGNNLHYPNGKTHMRITEPVWIKATVKLISTMHE